LLIIQIPTGGALARQFSEQPPASVTLGDALVEHELTDALGNLEPPAAGEVVLSLPSPEALAREADEVRRVIARAGTGVQPLILVIEAAEQLTDEQLAIVVEAAGHTQRPVILRVIREG
jgi:hypothetical protein